VDLTCCKGDDVVLTTVLHCDYLYTVITVYFMCISVSIQFQGQKLVLPRLRRLSVYYGATSQGFAVLLMSTVVFIHAIF